MNQTATTTPIHTRLLGVITVAGALVLSSCSAASLPTTTAANSATTTASPATSTAEATTTTQSGSTSTPAASSVILPVTDNPINNTSTVDTLKIDSVLVENNVDSNGAPTNDHLEITVSNTGSTELSGFEVYYTITDPTANLTENYYTKLPDSFTVPPGGQRTIHFDNSSAPDHFHVNEFSLYYTSTNQLNVSVMVSAVGAAPQTATVQKDAGGTETSD